MKLFNEEMAARAHAPEEEALDQGRYAKAAASPPNDPPGPPTETKISAERQFNQIWLKLAAEVEKLVKQFFNKVNVPNGPAPQPGFWPKFRQAVRNFWYGARGPAEPYKTESVDLDTYLKIQESVESWINVISETIDVSAPGFAAGMADLRKGLRVAARQAVGDVVKVVKSVNPPRTESPKIEPTKEPEIKPDFGSHVSTFTPPTFNEPSSSSNVDVQMPDFKGSNISSAEPEPMPATPEVPKKKRGRPAKDKTPAAKAAQERIAAGAAKAAAKQAAKSAKAKAKAEKPKDSDEPTYEVDWSSVGELSHLPREPHEPAGKTEAYLEFSKMYDNLTSSQKKKLKESLINSLTVESKANYYKMLLS